MISNNVAADVSNALYYVIAVYFESISSILTSQLQLLYIK